MAPIIYEYEIPDPNRPIPDDERGMVGPSGQLVQFVPELLDPAAVIGQQIHKLCTHAGTYGMGGPGFLGLRLDSNWLIVAVWGATEWMQVDGRPFTDHFYIENNRALPWINDAQDEISEHIVGYLINYVKVGRHALDISLSSGKNIVIDETADKRPILEGSKEPRMFSDDDDLRKAVFLSPTIEIWV